MKKPNIDLSKEGLQSFLLHHAEKLILGLALILFGVFFYLGFKTKPYEEKTPPQLSQLAQQAGQHIVSPASWEKIEPFRQGNDKSHIRIENASKTKVDASKYPFKRLMGIKAKTLGLRLDPELNSVEELKAVAIKAPVLLYNKNGAGAISSLPEANQIASADDEDRDDGAGGLGGGGLGGLGSGESDEADGRKKKEEESEVGTEVPPVQAQAMVGVRPQAASLSENSCRSRIFDIIAVTGVVRFENQWEKYKKALEENQGYYPPRDKPIYVYAQIERKEKDGDWEDISERISDVQPGAFPPTLKLGAPEVIDPDYYDPVLSGFIPPFSLVDYRKFATHEKVPLREFVPEDDTPAETVEENGAADDDDFDFGQTRSDNTGSNKDGEMGDRGQGAGQRSGDRKDRPTGGGTIKGSDRSEYERVLKAKKPTAPFKLFRFYDLLAKPGKEYKYRVRLWLADPNNEDPIGVQAASQRSRDRDAPSSGMAGGGGGSAGLEGGSTEGGGGAGSADDDDESNYLKVPITSKMLDDSVRKRLRKQKPKLPKFTRESTKKTMPDILRYARPTDDWVETPWVSVPKSNNSAEFYAGSVDPGRTVRVNGKTVPSGEPSAEVVAAVWSTKYGTAIPGKKEVGRSDVLNFETDSHLLHPIDWSVRKLEQADIETDAVVVDIIGGESLPTAVSKLPYSMPGEVLIMDADGKFRVQNEVKDRQGYRHALFLDDEVAEVGGKKKKKKEDRDEDFPGG